MNFDSPALVQLLCAGPPGCCGAACGHCGAGIQQHNTICGFSLQGALEPLEGTSRGGCCTPQGTLRGEAERRSVGDKAESQHARCFPHTAGGLQNAHITQSRVCCHCFLCAKTNERSGSATARTSVLVAVENCAHTLVFVALCRPAPRLRSNARTPDPVPLRQRSSKGVQPWLLQAVLPGAGRGPWSCGCCVLHSPQGLTCRVSCGSSWVLCTGCEGCK